MAELELGRVLVANRGEIARRIIKGAHDAGIAAVAIFAPDDAGAPYVGEADVAVALSGKSLAETYLSIEAVIAAAQTSGADAIHPGYGFLSENADLAQRCEAAGLVWVGPSPSSMRVMGHKARAKAAVASAGVPVLESAVLDPAMNDDEVAAAAAPLGYPVLVKASAGGGGRGMRLVKSAADLVDAVAAARREAGAAFGSDEVFVERYLASPRHIEVQVVGDHRGTLIHLFDRECSVQRRHQKVIEEAPAAMVAHDTRAQMWRSAIAAAAAVDYRGVGTVEFLVDGDAYYFLEMNTRLQVEHGVTELITGVDLVGLQFSVASGAAVPAQGSISATGHAVEARLCAERPREDYRPTPGVATHVAWPRGPGLRVDAAIESHNKVSASYDSLVAKVMAHADSRHFAIARLRRALTVLELDGLETNRDLLAAVVADEAFERGDIGIDFLDARRDLRDGALGDDVRCRHGAAAGFALLRASASRSLVPGGAAGWRNVGVAGHIDDLRDAHGVLEVHAPSFDRPASVRIDEEWRVIATTSLDGEPGVVDLLADGLRRRYAVRISAHGVEVNGPEGQSSFLVRSPDDEDQLAGLAGECRATLPGAITKILVHQGDQVAEGDGLVVLEAMKMEHTLRSGGAGTVGAVHCTLGQQVDLGDLLVTVTPQ